MSSAGNDMIRRQILVLRRGLDEQERERLSQRICERFLSLFPKDEAFWRGLKIVAYRATPEELDPTVLLSRVQALGAQIFYPRIVDREKKLLEFHHVAATALPEDWEMGPFGVWEPRPGLPTLDSSGPQLVFVPGVAFGEGCERIGMGAGFYDRTLGSLTKGIRVALAFDFQLFPRLEQNPWDCPMDWIITEKREVKGPQLRSKIDEVIRVL